MKLLVTFFSVLLTCMTVFGTAHADVIDPGNPYRKPNRPIKPVPVTRVYRMRAPDFTLTKIEEEKNMYLLKVTLPGPCEWKARAFVELDGTTKEVDNQGPYSVPDLKQETDSREVFLMLPEGKERAKFLVAVEFTLYRFQETTYGPKVYDTDIKTHAVQHVYEMETVDGKQILKKL